MIRWSLLIIGVLLIIDFVYAASNLSMNVGVIMPLFLGLPLVLISIFYPNWLEFSASGTGKVLRLIVVFSYVLFILLFGIVLSLMLSSAKEKSPDNVDVIIVLGAALNGNRPSKLLALRLDSAIEYLDRNPETLVVVSGGQSTSEVISESEAMANYLYENGISRERVIIEDNSETTEENFRFSIPLIEKHFGRSAEDLEISFVTSGFHVYRSKMIARELGLNLHSIAAASSWQYIFNHAMREFVAIIVCFIAHSN